ncbi:MAG TPA: hypothetical protein VMS77_10115 [Conexivisphaerales archaeon]|nr:hypothetical protein [Conexivisphaerales archaeon]
MKRKGLRTRVSWMRGTHTFASLLATMMSKFPTLAGSDNFYYHIYIPKKLLRVWQLVEFVSMLPVLLVRFTLPSLLGAYVVAERYIPDFLVWVTLTTRDPSYPRTIYGRFLLSLLSRTRTKYYITADFPELVRRREDMDPAFLKAQLEAYSWIAKSVGAATLNTTNMTVEGSARTLVGLVDRDMASASAS